MNTFRPIQNLLLSFLICGCSRQSGFTNGVSVNVSDADNVTITLKSDTHVTIRQFSEVETPDNNFIHINNIGNKLQIYQREENIILNNLDVRHSLEAVNTDTVTVFDLDGDGIPERKYEGSKEYKFIKMVWEPVTTSEKTEQGAAANP